MPKRRKEVEIDVFLLCALPEESHSVVRIFSQQNHNIFTEHQFSDGTYYQTGVIENNFGESVRIGVAYQPSEGENDTILMVHSRLTELKMRFCFMCGICGGDEQKASLGDVVVVKLAVKHTGKAETNGDMSTEVRPYEPSHIILSWIRGMNNSWQKGIIPYKYQPVDSTEAKQPRLIKNTALKLLMFLHDKESEKDCLTATDFHCILTKGIVTDTIHLKSVIEHAQKRDWLSTERQPKITDCGLKQISDVMSMLTIDDAPKSPKALIASMFTGPYVKENLPDTIARIRQDTAQRKIIGVDMEVHSFYHACKELKDVEFLAAKGICDHGDRWKDDFWHEIAADNAAAWFLEFIKKYIRSVEACDERSLKRIRNGTEFKVSDDFVEDDEESLTVKSELIPNWNEMMNLVSQIQENQSIVSKTTTEKIEAEQNDTELSSLIKERKTIEAKISEKHEPYTAQINDATQTINKLTKKCQLLADNIAREILKQNHSQSSVVFIKHNTHTWELQRSVPKAKSVSENILITKLGSEQTKGLMQSENDERRRKKKFQVMLENTSVLDDITAENSAHTECDEIDQ